jgi:hypothetical protein
MALTLRGFAAAGHCCAMFAPALTAMDGGNAENAGAFFGLPPAVNRLDCANRYGSPAPAFSK